MMIDSTMMERLSVLSLYIMIGGLLCFDVVLAKPSNIVIFMADDLGYNDISITNPSVKTPNIGSLADDGMFLTQSYVQPACSPSRHSFLTGRYPFRDGLQHLVIREFQAVCSPLDLKMFPEKLQQQGYATHLIGKWHMGFCNWGCTPRYRGFDTFYGIYNGAADFYTHKLFGHYDMRKNESVYEDTGNYVTFDYVKRTLQIIEEHDDTQPLFLYNSFQTPHFPVDVPDRYSAIYKHVEDPVRRKYLGMVSLMDEAIGNITASLKKHHLYDNTLIIFMSDNGGAPRFGGNNYPLRGGKNTLWEGGVRSPTLVAGGRVQKKGSRHDGLFHISDWYPTLMEMAEIPQEQLPVHAMDGVNQHDMVSYGAVSSRENIIHNLDTYVTKDLRPFTGHAAFRRGDYKLLWGFPGPYHTRAPPPEVCQRRQHEENIDAVLPSQEAHHSSCSHNHMVTGHTFDAEGMMKAWTSKYQDMLDKGDEDKLMLFNIKNDPHETYNLARLLPNLTAELKSELDKYLPGVAYPMVPPPHPLWHPEYYGNNYSPGWCSMEELNKTRIESLSYVSGWHADDQHEKHLHGIHTLSSQHKNGIHTGHRHKQRHVQYDIQAIKIHTCSGLKKIDTNSILIVAMFCICFLHKIPLLILR